MQLKRSISSYIILLLSICIIYFVTYKAANSSFTHDESFSYTRYVHTGFMDIISYKNPYPNNHILNTLLMKYSEMIFGSSELALRIPNILLFIVYLFFTFLFFKKNDPFISISIFILMIANPYLIDFFCLARGYGLSIGFMIMSLYFLIKSVHTEKSKHLILFNTSALFAILSNFTLLYFYIGSLIIYNLIKLLDHFVFKTEANKKYNFIKLNKINLIQFAIAVVILYEPIRRVIKFKLIDFGGKSGFMHDTVASLINEYFYDVFNLRHLTFENNVLKIIVLLIVFGSLFIILKKIYQKNKDFFITQKSLIIVNLILLFITLETIIAHYFFKTDYIIIRFALFLFPLFILNLGFLLEYLLRLKYRKIILFITIILALSSAGNMLYNLNSYSYNEWTFDMETKNAMKELIAYHKKNEPEKSNIKVGITWIFEPTMNYYKSTWKLDWLQPLDREGLHETDNYIYILPEDSAKIVHKNYKVIFSSKRINSVLLKNL